MELGEAAAARETACHAHQAHSGRWNTCKQNVDVRLMVGGALLLRRGIGGIKRLSVAPRTCLIKWLAAPRPAHPAPTTTTFFCSAFGLAVPLAVGLLLVLVALVAAVTWSTFRREILSCLFPGSEGEEEKHARRPGLLRQLDAGML